jgi:hypothetical protein
MKTIILQILILCLSVFSCINREKSVDQSKLNGYDYRLFQNTPAWELAKAVQDEDEKKINDIISTDTSLINYRESKYGSTLLFLAALNQQMKPFKVLIANKADVNIHDTYDGSSVLIQVCIFHQFDTKFAEILLQNGANVNDIETGKRRKGNSTRFTPLIAACGCGNLDMVKLLVNNGADINYQNEYKHSALSEAVMTERYEVVVFLLQNGADYNPPIFYRFGDSYPYRPEEDIPMYLTDVLREDFFEFNTDKYKYKMQIVDFLKGKGIDYRATPIPEYIQKKAKEKYPDSWREYLEKY